MDTGRGTRTHTDVHAHGQRYMPFDLIAKLARNGTVPCSQTADKHCACDCNAIMQKMQQDEVIKCGFVCGLEYNVANRMFQPKRPTNCNAKANTKKNEMSGHNFVRSNINISVFIFQARFVHLSNAPIFFAVLPSLSLSVRLSLHHPHCTAPVVGSIHLHLRQEVSTDWEREKRIAGGIV